MKEADKKQAELLAYLAASMLRSDFRRFAFLKPPSSDSPALSVVYPAMK